MTIAGDIDTFDTVCVCCCEQPSAALLASTTLVVGACSVGRTHTLQLVRPHALSAQQGPHPGLALQPAQVGAASFLETRMVGPAYWMLQILASSTVAKDSMATCAIA